ncbi:MAG: putative ABC transporter permease [Clostridiales bacterium]|nr:putative ABC transporter permease [Clostridiales bacterium]
MKKGRIVMHFYPLVDSYCMFFIYAFLGWILEVIYYGFDEGRFINRGFLNGPLCPVYGVGFYGVILILEKIKFNFFLLFFGSMTICTFVEFWAGFILFKLFKMRWWDYTDEKLNLWGFICPKFSLYWGIACSFGIYVLHPSVLWTLARIPEWLKILSLGFLSIILLCDIVATVCALVGLKKKILIIGGISSEMKVISDKIGGGIYGGVDTVITKSQPTRDAYNDWRELYQKHRKEEKDLAKKHRDEERALLAKLKPKEIKIGSPKEALGNTKDAIGKKVTGFAKLVRHNEQRLVKTVKIGISGYGKSALSNISSLSKYLPRIHGEKEELIEEEFLTMIEDLEKQEIKENLIREDLLEKPEKKQ